MANTGNNNQATTADNSTDRFVFPPELTMLEMLNEVASHVPDVSLESEGNTTIIEMLSVATIKLLNDPAKYGADDRLAALARAGLGELEEENKREDRLMIIIAQAAQLVLGEEEKGKAVMAAQPSQGNTESFELAIRVRDDEIARAGMWPRGATGPGNWATWRRWETALPVRGKY